MDLELIRDNLKAYLTAILGITDWDTIQFSLLPTDNPRGYFQVVEVTPSGSTVVSTWIVGIGIGAETLGDLNSQVSALVKAVVDNLGQNNTCLAGLGSVKLSDSIEIEVPNTYSQQSSISLTTGFTTSISFGIQVTSAN